MHGSYHAPDELPALISSTLRARGLTQSDVAERLGMTQSAISQALGGKSPGVLKRIAEDVLGWQVEPGWYRVTQP